VWLPGCPTILNISITGISLKGSKEASVPYGRKKSERTTEDGIKKSERGGGGSAVAY